VVGGSKPGGFDLLGVAGVGCFSFILVTTSNFTKETKSFAAGKAIRLIDGPALLPLVRSVQKDTLLQASEASTLTSRSQKKSTPMCAKCGSPMVLRTAKRGANAGNQFWGCSTYPKCRQTHREAESD
jgi:restriction system protein